jgi:hypothetical protein
MGVAAMPGAMPEIVVGRPHGAALAALAGGFALWGGVREARSTGLEKSRDLALPAVWAARSRSRQR